MTTIFFTRHGETEWNIQRRMQGWLDSPLTEQGKQQAIYLGERLNSVSLSAVYPSVAPRAIATAELICGSRSIPIVPLEGFREMGLGEWEGCLVEDLLSRESENSQNFFHHPDKYNPPKGAESFEEVRLRIEKTLTELVAKHCGESILVVAHGILMRSILAYLSQRAIQDVWSDHYKPTALSLVTAGEGSFEVRYWNDTSHYKV